MRARRVSMLFLLAVGGALCSGSPSPAQRFRIGQLVEFAEEVQLPEADNVARAHLETIDRFVEAGQWDEAIEALGRLMDLPGDRLLPAPGSDSGGGFVRYMALRDYCHLRLAAMSGSADEALALYRSRVDVLAESWFREAQAGADADALRRVVDRFFVSSSGDEALYHLGELALNRGDFTRAREAWERISPRLRSNAAVGSRAGLAAGRPLWLALRAGDWRQSPEPLESLLAERSPTPSWLAYPDSRLDLADVRARLVLVSILEGSPQRAELELEVFRQLHGAAVGTLAGRQAPYCELLAQLLEQSRGWTAPPPTPDWPTFGGSATRGKVAAGDIDVALRPIWTVELPRLQAEQQWIDGVARPADDGEGLLSYHPLVVGDKVLVCAGQGIDDVQAFDLHSGRALWPAPPPQAAAQAPAADGPLALALGRPTPQEQLGVSRFTMTADAGRLYVKLGTYATSLIPNERFDPPLPGFLAALDLQADKKLLFEIRAEPAQAEAGWAFEGAPLVDGENLYVAMRRRENLRSQAHVACYSLRRNRAELRWRTFLASAETPGQGDLDEYTHNLLTLDEGVIYANTNLGAVAALDAGAGRIRWLCRYPRAPLTRDDSRRNGRYLLRDLNPCLVWKDYVIVAPSDSDRIFSLDAATGMLVWDAGSGRAEDAVQLLGVGEGNLLAGGDRLYWIDVHSGRERGRFPQRVEVELRGYGRGVLAGQSVLWPTRERIYVLAQDGPRPLRQPIELAPIGMTGGNLVPAGEMLLVAGADRLAAYNPWGRQITKAE